MSKTEWWKKAFEKGIYPLDKIFKSVKFRGHTDRQVDFIAKVLKLKPSQKLLDVGCGTGRHSILFAKKGNDVTGIDISKKYLRMAKADARRNGVSCKFLFGDMRKIRFSEEFDAAINLFSSFGYFEKKSDDLKTLVAIKKALKKGGKLVVDTINGVYLSKNFINKNWNRMDGLLVLEESEWVKRENRVHTKWTFIHDDREEHMESRIRIYTKESLSQLLDKAGFKVLKYFGSLAGARFSPQKSSRLVVLAQKDK